jgi:membrane-associated protein
MESILHFFQILLSSEELLKYGGLLLLLLVIYAETGLFFGIIFPGDALLFTAGIFCGTGGLDVNIFLLVLTVALSAIVGNLTGFVTGKYLGKRLFQKKDTWVFKQKHIEQAREYYDHYGGVSLIGGRFLPVIRTFVPILAGAIDMNFWKFNLFNITGAILWSGTLIPLGYILGRKIPASADNVEYIILGITAITMTIMITGIIRRSKNNKSKKQ